MSDSRPSVPVSHANEAEHRRQLANSINLINQSTPDYRRTDSEISAGVTPVDYRYPEGDVRRYDSIHDVVPSGPWIRTRDRYSLLDFCSNTKRASILDGTLTDVTTELQEAADQDDNPLPVDVPPAQYVLSDTIKIRQSRVWISGPRHGMPGRWGFGNLGTDRRGPVEFLYDGLTTDRVFEVGSEAATTTRYVAVGGYKLIEDIYLGHFLVAPLDKPSGFGAGDLITLDGSNTIEATRGILRNVTLDCLSLAYSTGKGIVVLGDVFDVVMLMPSVYQTKGVGISVELATSNVAPDQPGEIHLLFPYVNNVLTGTGVTGVFSMDLQSATVFGGKVQGDSGVRLGYANQIYGLDVERAAEAPADTAKVGLQIDNAQWNEVHVPFLRNYGTALQFGAGAGDANLAVTSEVHIGRIQKASVGVLINDGGTRSGNTISVRSNGATTAYINNRSAYHEINYTESGRPVESIQTNFVLDESLSATTVTAGATLDLPTRPIVTLSQSTGGTVTLDTTTPITVTGAYRGQRVTFVNVSQSGTSNAIAFPHSVNCRNKGQATQIIQPGESITYIYIGALGGWMQEGT